MAREGHIKIARKAYEDDPFWNEKREFSRWEAWEDMIQYACWKDQRWYVEGEVVQLKRGQLLASERFLATRWSWSRGKVRRFLGLCQDLERITVETDHPAAHVGAIITLCNYDTYQSYRPTGEPDTSPETDQVRTTDGPPADQKQCSEYSQCSEDSKDTRVPYQEAFTACWDAYPSRAGGNPKKAAYKAWVARVREGVDPDELLKATQAYAKHCRQSGRAGTEFVMMGRTFYGPNERWAEWQKKAEATEASERRRLRALERLEEDRVELSPEERQKNLETIRKIRQNLKSRRPQGVEA